PASIPCARPCGTLLSAVPRTVRGPKRTIAPLVVAANAMPKQFACSATSGCGLLSLCVAITAPTIKPSSSTLERPISQLPLDIESLCVFGSTDYPPSATASAIRRSDAPASSRTTTSACPPSAAAPGAAGLAQVALHFHHIGRPGLLVRAVDVLHRHEVHRTERFAPGDRPRRGVRGGAGQPREAGLVECVERLRVALERAQG